MKFNKLLLIVSLFQITLLSQNVIGWQNYSDMKNISGGVFASNIIWAATQGGVFQVNILDSIYNTFNKTEGLNGSAITAIATDNYGKIWLGSQNGIIDVYDPTLKSFKRILDVYNSERTLRQINDLRVVGDILFVSTDFGLSTIDTKTYSFIDTYFKFGNLSSNIKVNSSFGSEQLFVPTELGLAVQIPGSTNLSAPESWSIFTTSSGLGSNNVFKVSKFRDTILVSSNKGFAFFNGTNYSRFLHQFNQTYISDFHISGDTLFILTEETISSVKVSSLYFYQNGSVQQYATNLPLINKIITSTENGLILATNKGVLILSDTNSHYYFPDGPQSNFFSDLSIDNNMNLWAASGTDVSGVGFYKFDGEIWKNFNLSTTPNILSNSYYNTFSAPDGKTYLGSYGGGFARIDSDGEVVVFNTNNTPMLGTTRAPNYLVIPGLRTDSKNNLWILNHDAVNRKTLSMLTKDSVWYHFVNPADSNLNQYTKILIDQYDTKWFVSAAPSKSGLFYFNENNTLDNLTDDKYGLLSQTTGLNSNSITSFALDKRGDLWIGTNLGVNIISNTSVVLGNVANPQFKISSVFSLRSYSINCIAVDPINRKWIGTNQGLIVVSSDGTSLIAAYDTKNSPLLSDQIKSITIDEQRGIVYIGVDGGLTSVQTSAILPKENFDELVIYPSPFILNNSNNNLKIDGLIRDTDIKIITISGKLIKEFSSPGGRIAYWNGRDESENLVSTGIYFVVAYDKEGNNIAIGKIAIIRE
jgi:ligand-binding sensor domain-containing protein